MTVAQYLTPLGQVIQSKGLKPDIPVATMPTYARFVVDNFLPFLDDEKHPDLSNIDFDKVDGYLKSCKVPENILTAGSSSGIQEGGM